MAKVQHEEAWRRLHHQLRGIAKRRSALDAEEARCLREAHRQKLWRRFGYVHMNEYLERELGYSPQVGVERLRVALALADLPEIEAALDGGDLSYSAVRELTRIATPDTEPSWLEKARGKTLREIEQMISGKKRGDKPEDPSNPDLTTRVLRLELMPAVFAMFRQVQSALADEHGGRLDDSALIETLCRRALDAGSSTAHADRPAYQVAITVCEQCGRGWQNGAGREIDVGREIVDRARCDAEEIGSLTTRDPARVRSTVTPRVRRQVFARDHDRCTVPGCRSSRNLDLHHIEFQEHGGGHEMWNLTAVCSSHHLHLHDGKLAIRGRAPDALEFVWREHENAQSHRGDARSIREDAPTIDASAPLSDRRARNISEDERAVDEHPRPADGRTRRIEDAARAIDQDARMALVTAGFKAAEARDAVSRARPHVGAEATLEQVIRAALRQYDAGRRSLPPR